MKHSPHLKPLTNPTTTKATIYQYTAIGLVVLIHLLNDHPRHIRYRENHKENASAKVEQSQKGTSGQPPPPPSPPLPEHNKSPRSNKRREPQHSHRAIPQLSRRPAVHERQRQPYPRPATPPLPRRSATPPLPRRSSTPPLPNRPKPTRYDSAHSPAQPSRSQAHTAWTHIRNVTPSEYVLIFPSPSPSPIWFVLNEEIGKKVRWGGVRIIEFEDGEDGEEEKEVARGGGKEVNRQSKGKEVWSAMDDEDVWGPRRDAGIWGPVDDV